MKHKKRHDFRHASKITLSEIEVCGQSQKSVRWLINPRELFLHLPQRKEKRRLGDNVTLIETSDTDKIDEIFEKSDIYRAQSKEKASKEQLELLAVTENYLKETYPIPLTVIGNTYENFRMWSSDSKKILVENGQGLCKMECS